MPFDCLKCNSEMELHYHEIGEKHSMEGATMANDTMTLVLIRHGESEWNKKNLATGRADVDLSPAGREEADEGGKALKDEGYDFDLCYTSYIKRAIHTLNIVLDEMDRAWLPVV